MKKNMGKEDRFLRILFAMIVGVLYYKGVIEGTFAIVLGTLAVVFVLTSFLNFCPLYLPFGINTNKTKK